MRHTPPRNARELREAIEDDKRQQKQLELLPSHPQMSRKAAGVADFAARLAESEQTKARTEALVFARTIAMAGLPKRRTTAKMLSKTLRLGSDLWLRVSYNTNEDNELPFGEDRFVLAALQHLAIQQESPLIYFDHVGTLLEMFGFGRSGRDYERLRERFMRLSTFSIRLVFAETEAGLKEQPAGEQSFVIERWALPTQKQIQAIEQGQMLIPTALPSRGDGSPFGVKLSAGFWEHLQEKEHHLLAPVALLKLFIDCPTGWDYLCFLIARCGRARSSTVVDHHILMELFKEGKEPDRKTVARLQKYHDVIMTATRGNLKASIEQMGKLPRKEGARGPQKTRWVLKIHPSEPIVFSGKKVISAELKR